MEDLLKALNSLKDKRNRKSKVKFALSGKTPTKSNKVDLAMVDEINYKLDDLRDETSRLSYSTEEWFDEKFEEFYQLRSDLKSVYFQNSEAFLTLDDVAEDRQTLLEIREKSEELGIDVTEVYPEYYAHLEEIDLLEFLDRRFDEQVQQLKDIGF